MGAVSYLAPGLQHGRRLPTEQVIRESARARSILRQIKTEMAVSNT